jgi:tRNA G18 (ribose-2'-O)-methylase SpoU
MAGDVDSLNVATAAAIALYSAALSTVSFHTVTTS